MQKRISFSNKISKDKQRQIILALYVCLTVVMVIVLTLIISHVADTLEYRAQQRSLSELVNASGDANGGEAGRIVSGAITRGDLGGFSVTSDVPESIDFNSLTEINAQTKGWIYLSDSVINYPIMQSRDNEYYLNHIFDGQVNSAGSLFLDYRTKDIKSDRCVIIYGHNIKNGTMFGGLKKYKDPEYYGEHRVMYIFVPEGRYQVEIIAASLIKADDDMYVPSNWDTYYEEYVDRLVDGSMIEGVLVKGATLGSSAVVGETAETGDLEPDKHRAEDERYVLLSTCDYTFSGARLVVLGRFVGER